MNSDLEKNLNSFYTLTEDKQEQTLNEILAMANSNKENFIEMLHAQKFNGLNNLPIFYEALSNDLVNWASFFILEAKRLLHVAHKSEKPSTVLNHFSEFSFINPDHFVYRDELIEILLEELNDQQASIRYFSLETILDFINKNDKKAILRLGTLLNDSNWRIRYWAYLGLKELDSLPEGRKMAIFDKMRVRLLDPYKFK
tara:strand:- start:254 stop:850 length:597 start_codon:yes stop_codon:yes gene_type:complete